MEQDYDTSIKHGFIIAKIHGKVISMFKDSDYSSIQQCETLEDTIVKLSGTSYQKFLTEEVVQTKKEFKEALNKSLIKEYEDFYRSVDKETRLILDYFKNHYKIQNFVYLLASKEEDPDLEKSYGKIEPLGDFNELCTLKIANDMNDVYKFCVETTFLKKYYQLIKFEREIKNNDFQIIQSLLLKYHLEDLYEDIKDNNTLRFMIEILKSEGDRRIIEIVLNTIDSNEIVGKRRERLFPKISSIDLGMQLKLGQCNSIDELRGILSAHLRLRKIVTVEDDEIINTLAGLEMEQLWKSFSIFNDISCVYGYLKLKEQEIKNILWTVECISLKKKDYIKNIIIPHNSYD